MEPLGKRPRLPVHGARYIIELNKINRGTGMEAVKIIMPAADRKPCVCGATLSVSRTASNGHLTELWLCSRHCGARGLTYEGALRRKIRLDLLSWGDLRRNAQALVAAHSDDQDEYVVQ
jgi:hypothetical protein